jgi:SAM-dependent methyltransferase
LHHLLAGSEREEFVSLMLKDLARSWVLPFVDPRRLVSVVRLPGFFADWLRFRGLAGSARFADLRPCLTDRASHTPFDPHYFYQAAWLARELSGARPPFHVDVGSSVVATGVLSAFVPLLFVDFRPLRASLPNLESIAADITRLPFSDASVQSLSSLHVIEHIGLGRYGDRLDPDGWRAGLSELARVLAPGGRLYLSTPVGRNRVCFNAHRVFSPRVIVDALPALMVEHFAVVDDEGRFRDKAELAEADTMDYGCGMFRFSK